MTKIQKIIVIDDQRHNLMARPLKAFLPDAEIKTVTNFYEAKALFESGFIPDIVSTDCFDVGNYNSRFGIENAHKTMEWFSEHRPENAPPLLFFKSADLEMAQEAETATLRFFPQALSYAIDVSEMFLAQDIHENDRQIGHREAKTTTFRAFLKEHLNLALPMSEDEIDAFILARGDLEAEDIVNMVNKSKFDRDEALTLIGKEAIETSHSRYEASVDMVQQGNYKEIKDLSSIFSQSVGVPVNGYAAFDLDEVRTLVSAGKKPVLFLEDYTTSFIPHLGDLAGIVLLDAGLSGHMQILLASHGVTGALGAKDMRKHFSFIQKPDGRPLQTTQEISGAGTSRVFTNFENAFYHAGNKHIDDHMPKDGWSDDNDVNDDHLSALPPLIIDPSHADKNVAIRSGDRVTIITSRYGDHAELWPTHLTITEAPYESLYRWTSHVQRWLQDWHSEKGITGLKFKSNVDAPDQYAYRDGIGLLRTEHFILSSAEQLSFFKRAILNQDDNAFAQMRQALDMDLRGILYPAHDDFPVRIRLMDMPPAEAFDQAEQTQFETLYGDKNLRGVQLAAQIPALYKAQIRAIFDAVIVGHKDCATEWGNDESDTQRARVEIMVPLTKTAAELCFVKAMVRNIAAEYDLSEKDYTFGSMLETIEACENIKEIVAECDFLSIGSNDLTEAILDCPRHDYEARHAMMTTHKEDKDPFLTLYKPVIKAIREAASRARSVKPDIQIDLCGAHAQDLASLNLLRDVKLNSVSLPPTEINMNTLRMAYDYQTFETVQAQQAQPDIAPILSKK